ncbi:MAG TPA: homoserine O-succinyltransferase [Rhizomicrobium sp.]|nr:homoserine O-succinyltransferase [Rhizomicrobium sp.]
MDMPPVEKFALGGAARGTYRGALHVGLVNNMPDAALRTTELQFARLLKDASGAHGAQPLDVRLHLFSLSQIPRGDVALARMAGFYADASLLPAAGLDALIITGAEPRTEDLRDEPYWDALARLIDWADGGVISTYFSCLAAHAAVLHRDGIARRKLGRKLSGVFSVRSAIDEALLAGVPALAQVPHSRRNDVPEEALVARNYRILSWLADGGVDLFMYRGRSLQIFAQGHPEYDSGTLGREYLRDLGRHLRGEGERPAVPEQYFDRVTEVRLAELDSHAPGDLSRYTSVVMGAVPFASWRSHTVRLFANWLAGIAAEKIRRSASRSQTSRSRKRA